MSPHPWRLLTTSPCPPPAQDTIEYVHEAVAAGLVDVSKGEAGIIVVSVRGSRQIGVVKWVKESYGFIQSALHSGEQPPPLLPPLLLSSSCPSARLASLFDLLTLSS